MNQKLLDISFFIFNLLESVWYVISNGFLVLEDSEDTVYNPSIEEWLEKWLSNS